MAENKSKKPVFIAHVRRNEINGMTYNIGQEADLSALSDEQIGHVVGRGYYGVINPDALTEAQQEAIKKELG